MVRRYPGLRSLEAGENVIMKRRSIGRDRVPRAWWMFSASAPRLLRITDLRAREYRHVSLSLSLSLSLFLSFSLCLSSLSLLQATSQALPIYAPMGQPFYVNRAYKVSDTPWKAALLKNHRDPSTCPFIARLCPSITLKWLIVWLFWQSRIKHTRLVLCLIVFELEF